MPHTISCVAQVTAMIGMIDELVSCLRAVYERKIGETRRHNWVQSDAIPAKRQYGNSMRALVQANCAIGTLGLITDFPVSIGVQLYGETVSFAVL